MPVLPQRKKLPTGWSQSGSFKPNVTKPSANKSIIPPNSNDTMSEMLFQSNNSSDACARERKQGVIGTTPLTEKDEMMIASRISGLMCSFEDSSSELDSDFEDDFEDDDVELCSIWISNLAVDISESNLRHRMEIFGPVSSVRILRASQCACVVFRHSEHADDCLNLEGTKIGHNVVSLNIGTASRHLWIGNLDKVTPAMLKRTFARFGDVTSVKVFSHKKCAFVNFDKSSDALRAMEALSGTKLGKKLIRIQFQWPSDSQQENSTDSNSESKCQVPSAHGSDMHLTPCRSLFVGNIGVYASQARLVALFSRFGHVDLVESYISNGFAFIVYDDIKVSSWVREQMTLFPPILAGQPLKVTFGRPLPSENGQPPAGYEYQLHSRHNAQAPPQFVTVKL